MSQREPGTTARPVVAGSDLDRLADCIDACVACARACLAAAEARRDRATDGEAEEEARLGVDCADLCEATGRLLSRRSGANTNLVRAFLDTCASACDAWAAICRPHDVDPRCREAVAACVTCARCCRDLAARMA